jgi:hypothetical protein
MKKPTVIAAAVLGALLLVTAAWKISQDRSSTTPEGGFSVPAGESLDKVEIADGDKKTVLVRKDDVWRLVEPIDYAVDKIAGEDLDKIFKAGLGTDLNVVTADTKKYEFEGAPTVTLFAGETLIAKFLVGKEISVKGTGAKRTWIQPEGQQGAYRAQAGLRTTLVRELAKWRNKQITDFKDEDVNKVTMSYDGLTVVLERKAGEKFEGLEKTEGIWTALEPKGVEVDSQAVERWVGAAGRLRIDAFQDDATPEAAGLDKPAATYTFSLTGGDTTLHVGGPVPPDTSADGDAKKQNDTYLSIGGQKWVYSAKSWATRSVFKKLGDLRAKEVLKLDKATVTGLSFKPEGEERALQLRLKEGTWSVVRGDGKPLDQSIVQALLRTSTNLRASKLAESNQTPTDTGLGSEEREAVVLSLQDGSTTTIFLGAKAEESKDDRWAQVGPEGQIFLLAGYNVKKLRPKLDSLIRKPGSAPKSAPAGLGGLPPGMKLPPGVTLPPGMQPGGR